MSPQSSDPYKALLEIVNDAKRTSTVNYSDDPKPVDLKIERARQKQIQNDNLISDQKMEKWSLFVLFIFLGLETAVVFVIIFLQGFQNSFYLEEWSFRSLLAGTLLQITAMLTIAIKHLFPSKT